MAHYKRGYHGRILKGNKPYNTGITKYPVIDGKKQCRDCGKWLLLSKYYRSLGSSGGVSNVCKGCSHLIRKRNWPKVLTRTRAHRRTPAGYYTSLKSGNSHRKKKGLSKHTVLMSQKEFVEWDKKQIRECYYCEFPEVLLSKVDNISNRTYRHKFYRLTLDRKDNKKNYSINNIVLACPICNETKGAFFNAIEFKKLAQMFIKPKWKAKYG